MELSDNHNLNSTPKDAVVEQRLKWEEEHDLSGGDKKKTWKKISSTLWIMSGTTYHYVCTIPGV